jgi:hypothetical protein
VEPLLVWDLPAFAISVRCNAHVHDSRIKFHFLHRTIRAGVAFVHSEVNNSYLEICSHSRRDFFLLGTAPEKSKIDLNVTCRTLTFVN